MTKEELIERLQSHGLDWYHNEIEPHLRNTIGFMIALVASTFLVKKKLLGLEAEG